MAFVVCPDGGPNRIFRFGDLSDCEGGVLAVNDKAANILHIRKDLFEQLTPLDQQRVFTCDADMVAVYESHGVLQLLFKASGGWR